ncbi:MAG: hypothetical protein KAT12_09135, partial [Gammaproteobacteria bacterium]|nr:hypothetical protein [Gammaproteobacteria bacterium]
AIAMPDISHQPVRLTVASVVNPRFKQLSVPQIQKILLRSQQMVKQHFQIDVVFSDVATFSVEDVFSHLDPQVADRRRKEIVNINFIDDQVREDMQRAVFETLANYAGNRLNVIGYAQPFLLNPEIKHEDFISLSYALVDTLISRLQYWKTQVANDGRPVLDEEGYHEWVWWDSLGYSDLSYDILITNQLVASAEYYAMDVHSSIRGGITAGTTTYNKNTAFNSYVYVMLYPMLNDSVLLTTLRQDETYSDDQIINYSAALLTHELGHMLLHLGHPFGNKHCIMSPTVMLNYRDWYENLDAERCAVGSTKEMTPGAATIEYNRNW